MESRAEIAPCAPRSVMALPYELSPIPVYHLRFDAVEPGARSLRLGIQRRRRGQDIIRGHRQRWRRDGNAAQCAFINGTSLALPHG